MKKVVQNLTGLEKVVVSLLKDDKEVNSNNNGTPRITYNDIPNYCTLDEFLSTANKNEELIYEQVPFDHPLCILFSSGTTGVPKCLVHSVGVRKY